MPCKLKGSTFFNFLKLYWVQGRWRTGDLEQQEEYNKSSSILNDKDVVMLRHIFCLADMHRDFCGNGKLINFMDPCGYVNTIIFAYHVKRLVRKTNQNSKFPLSIKVIEKVHLQNFG